MLIGNTVECSTCQQNLLGGFCHTCFRDFKAKSADPRYCPECFDLLMDEASMLPPKKRPAWIPKIGDKKTIPVPQDTVLNMHTINGENIRSVHNSPAALPVKPSSKRGPKHRDLPEDLIRQWADQGMGSKSIAARLKREQSIEVHYSTIQRILKGQRVLV